MRQKIILIFIAMLQCSGVLPAQDKVRPRGSTRIVIDGHPATIRLAPHFTTTIRLPEPVSSVVVGDSALFQAEHAPNEPRLVFVRPTSPAGESNLVISTASGRQFSMLLQSGTESFDPLVVCRASGSSFIEETYSTSLVAETLALGATRRDESPSSDGDPFSGLLDQQRAREQKAPVGDRLKVEVGRVVQRDSRFVVLFSVVNGMDRPVELVPPQIQLAGRVKSGLFGRGTKWTTVDQILVEEFRLTQRMLPAGSRADGLLVFERPGLKQSNEGLLLQVAEAARVDQPVLVPIMFSADQSMEEGK